MHPKGILKNLNSPSYVTNPKTSLASGVVGMFKKPDFISIPLKILLYPKLSITVYAS